MHQRGFSLNSHRLCRICDGGFEVSDLVNQLHRQSFLAGPNLAVGDGLDIIKLQTAPIGNGFDELPEHVIDQRLHIRLFGSSEVAGRIARVLEFASLKYDVLHLGPLQ